MAIEHFDAAAIDTRYGLDYATHLTCRERPASIFIASRQEEVLEAVIRRLPCSIAISVLQPEAAAIISERLAREVTSGTGQGVDAIIVPFAAEEWMNLPKAPYTVVVEHNAWSYKSVIAPGYLHQTAGDITRWMNSRCTITERVGLMGLEFIALWSLAERIGHHRSNWHFRLRDLATQRIFSKGSLWRFCYVVIVAGRHS